ncbi:GNAT family N-acetyltransferase [Streptomyces sp. NPDC088910]|uniref:GNAT family N-acetyltransferase n=1 Tax=Streptomyces sp. NPDC088910 TaxID=3365911 RepID=UPI00381A7F10
MIRTATPDDVPVIHALIRELAEYERALEEARATQEQLHAALFGPDAVAHALIAEEPAKPAADGADDGSSEGEGEGAGSDSGAGAGTVVGFALWFRNFSTWTGTPGLYLEDLYVRPQARGGGHGKALLAALAAVCVERGYERFEWAVLDWNEKALGVYRSIGARPQDEWTVQRLSGPALAELAALAHAR